MPEVPLPGSDRVPELDLSHAGVVPLPRADTVGHIYSETRRGPAPSRLRLATRGGGPPLRATRTDPASTSRVSMRGRIRRLGNYRATPTTRLRHRRHGQAPLSRAFSIGAPRFELGTSGPPDCSAAWRKDRASGGTWLGYAKSDRSSGRESLSSKTPVSNVWVRIGYWRNVSQQRGRGSKAAALPTPPRRSSDGRPRT